MQFDNKKTYYNFTSDTDNSYNNKTYGIEYPKKINTYSIDPILNSIKRSSEKITFDNSIEDMLKISDMQSKFNKSGILTDNGKKLEEDGIFGEETKSVYDKIFSNSDNNRYKIEPIKQKNMNLVSEGLDIKNNLDKNLDNWDNIFKIADFQNKLNQANFTDFEDKKLKEDGVWGPITESSINSYIWEDNNNGIILLRNKAHDKTNWDKNPNSRKGSENRQPTGERERNVKPPEVKDENGKPINKKSKDEHSRKNKNIGKRTNKPVPNQSHKKIQSREIGKAALGGVATVGLGYLVYRGVRMLPSLLPPLWWTIPANVAVI